MGIGMGCDAMSWVCTELAVVSPFIEPIAALLIDAPNTGVIASIRQAKSASA